VIVAAWWDYLRFWVWTAETWAGLQFGVLFGAAVVALRQLGEAQKLREGTTRPFVVADFEIERNIEIHLAITNMGATLARDVRVTFDYPFETGALNTREGELRAIDRFVARLGEGIPILVPGKTIRTLLDLSNHRGEPGTLRDRYEATVTYEDGVTGKHYTDEYILDLSVYRGRIHVNRKDIHEVHGQLEKLVGEVQNVRRSGLSIITRRDRHLTRAEWETDDKTRSAPRAIRWFYRLKWRAITRLM